MAPESQTSTLPQYPGARVEGELVTYSSLGRRYPSKVVLTAPSLTELERKMEEGEDRAFAIAVQKHIPFRIVWGAKQELNTQRGEYTSVDPIRAALRKSIVAICRAIWDLSLGR